MRSLGLVSRVVQGSGQRSSMPSFLSLRRLSGGSGPLPPWVLTNRYLVVAPATLGTFVFSPSDEVIFLLNEFVCPQSDGCS